MPASLSDLEYLALLALLQVGEDPYGAAIADCLAERAGRDVSIGTLYNTLVRLEERGLVESEMGDPTPVRGGKAKRLFRVTEAGYETLAEARAVMERMWEGLPAPDAG